MRDVSELRNFLIGEGYINIGYGPIPSGLDEGIGIMTTSTEYISKKESRLYIQMLIRTPYDLLNNKGYRYCQNRCVDIIDKMNDGGLNFTHRSDFFVRIDYDEKFTEWSLNIRF